MSHLLCPRCETHKPPTTVGAAYCYGDRWYCFRCSASGPVSEVGVKPSEKTAPKEYPPIDQVQKLWSLLGPVSGEVLDYVKSRLPFVESVPMHLARQMPEEYAEMPQLRGWKRSRRRLVFPLYSDTGQIRNVIGRSLNKTAKAKSMSLIGYRRSGLYLQNGMPLERGRDIVIGEGELDFLALSLLNPDATVYGIFSGSVGGWITQIPEESCVVIATDYDDQGEKYYQQIVDRLPRKVTVKRWEAKT